MRYIVGVYLFTDKTIIAIFDHMLSPGVVEQRNDLAPMLALLKYVRENGEVLGGGPSAALFVGVEMVEPSLAALLGTPEVLFSGVVVHPLRYFVPSPLLLFLEGLQQVLVFTLRPTFPLFGFEHIEVLELQKIRVFAEKDEGEVIPKVLLVGEFMQFDVFLLFLEVGKAYYKPHEDPSLILMPTILSHLEFLRDPVSKIRLIFTVCQYFHTVWSCFHR